MTRVEIKSKMEQIKKQIIEIMRGHFQKKESGKNIVSFSDIADEIMRELDIKQPLKGDINDFEKAVEPAIRYLLKHHNPHTKIFIDYSSAELLQGQMIHNLNNEVPD